MIRLATKDDIGRIAEILVFAKRKAYRPIFNNDYVSFNEITVLNVAKEYEEEGKLDNLFVYETDGIVKGLATFEADGDSLNFKELYVDPFFQNSVVGTRLAYRVLKYAKENNYKSLYCWVLEENTYARGLYEKAGLVYLGVKKEFANTGQYLCRYSIDL